MKTDPYVKASVRLVKFWEEAASKLGTNPAILRKVFYDRHYLLTPRDFISSITRSDDDYRSKEYRAEVMKELAQCKMTPAECDENERKYKERLVEHTDFMDLLNYRLKQLIQIRDEIVSDENKKFMSGKQYQTAGKRYKILSLDGERELTEFCATTNADLKGERICWSVYGILSLWRNGKEIWNWWRDYHALWVEQNPNHPQTAKMERQRDIRGDECARGVKHKETE